MKCKKSFYLISLLVDGELEGEERRRLEAHLDGCPRCREELERVKNLSALFKKNAVMPEGLSDEFLLPRISEAIVARRREYAADKSRRKFLFVTDYVYARRLVFGGAFAVLLAITGGAFLLRHNNSKHISFQEVAPYSYTTLSAYPSDEDAFDDELIKIYYGVYALSDNNNDSDTDNKSI